MIIQYAKDDAVLGAFTELERCINTMKGYVQMGFHAWNDGDRDFDVYESIRVLDKLNKEATEKLKIIKRGAKFK